MRNTLIVLAVIAVQAQYALRVYYTGENPRIRHEVDIEIYNTFEKCLMGKSFVDSNSDAIKDGLTRSSKCILLKQGVPDV